MASSAISRPHSPLPQRKSSAQFLCKPLFFFLFLLLLPLFPSQPPDFINHTPLTNFWELFHLFFVGIAVSYGLFSRRTAQVSLHESRFSNFENPQSYLSRMFHVSSIFEDVDDLSSSGSEDLSYIRPNRGSAADSADSSDYSMPQKRYENSCEFSDSDNVAHACQSRYTRGGSVVVVPETNRTSGESMDLGGVVVNYKPLGLPVRSLKSNLTEFVDDEFDYGDESCLSSKSSSNVSESNYERMSEFGDNCCTNLEEKFDEAVGSSLSPFQWRESFGKNVIRDNGVGNAVLRPSHFRPPSIDETQFDLLKKSRSFHSSPSQTSSVSPSLSSTTRMHRKMPSLGNISTKSLHSQLYSRSSLSENSRGSSEDPRIEQENASECNGSVVSSPHSDKSFASIAKALSRGKSVRTVRTNVVTMEEMKAQEVYRNQVEHDNNSGKKFEEAINGNGHGWSGVVNPNAGNLHRLSKMTFVGMDEQKEDTESLLTDDGKDYSELEDETIFASSDEEAGSSMAGESESGANEVDKKAGEFIAKFREQIQLQRMASVEKRLKGGWGSFSSTSSSYLS